MEKAPFENSCSNGNFATFTYLLVYPKEKGACVDIASKKGEITSATLWRQPISPFSNLLSHLLYTQASISATLGFVTSSLYFLMTSPIC
jgi:hypothetical protein